jgi:hypothetical protein
MEGYQEDLSSRAEWEIRNAQANKLALQVMEEKTFPWQGCSNVKFPLVTVAAMQYAARAYPALIDCTDLVNCVVYGEDPDGQKTARGDRIAAHMTWQNIRQDKGWEAEHDKAFLVQAIAGAAFMKKMYDPAKRHQVTKLVLPKNFVINYWTRDLESSMRYTEVFELTDNDIRQRELDGRFCKPPQDDSDGDQDDAKLPKQNTAGNQRCAESRAGQAAGTDRAAGWEHDPLPDRGAILLVGLGRRWLQRALHRHVRHRDRLRAPHRRALPARRREDAEGRSLRNHPGQGLLRHSVHSRALTAASIRSALGTCWDRSTRASTPTSIS